MPSTSDFKRGVRFLYESVPYQVTDVAFQSPSARGANTLVKLRARDLLSGSLKSFSFKAGERMEDPDIEMRKAQYLYSDPDHYHFMDMESYEQVAITAEQIGDDRYYLMEELVIRLMMFNGRPISIELPKAMDMEIIETDPGLKGDTVTNVTKSAKLSTGLEVQVPLFLNQGDIIRVDTTEGRYVERVRVNR